jgi:hypothetical protein
LNWSQKLSWQHLFRHWLASNVAVGPSTNDGREKASTSACMHKKQSAWSEFRQRHAIQTLGDAFGDSASTSDEFAAWYLEAGVYLFENSIAIPTRFGIDASMLGSHHHDRVKGQN